MVFKVSEEEKTEETCSDSSTETGMTVDLIDSVITLSHVLATRKLDLENPAIRAALADLGSDKSFLEVYTAARTASFGQIFDNFLASFKSAFGGPVI